MRHLALVLCLTACGSADSEPAATPSPAPTAKEGDKVEFDLEASPDGASVGVKTDKADVSISAKDEDDDKKKK